MYDKARTNSKWVGGPNEVFYRALFREGDVFKAHIGCRGYDFVQQLETDVCPIRDGWLDALVAEAETALDTAAAISGARVESDLVCSARKDDGDECTAAADHPDYIRQHVNGNALYHMGDRLQGLLAGALELYHDWPFDLAAYLTANATDQLHLLRYTKLVHNRVVPVHVDHMHTAALYDPQTYLVHYPSNFEKQTQMDATLATLARGMTAIVIGACSSMHPPLLHNLHLSLQRQGTRNVVWVAQLGMHSTLHAVMAMRPHAFVESHDLRPVYGHRDGCIPPLDTIQQLLDKQYDVLYLDADAAVIGNLTAVTSTLDRGAVHFASGAIQARGHYYQHESMPRYKFSSKAFFMPATPASAKLNQAWRQRLAFMPSTTPGSVVNAEANCSAIASCAWNGTTIRLLAPSDFVSGVNLVKHWPSSAALESAAAYIGVGAGLEAHGRATKTDYTADHARFRLQHAGRWMLPRDSTCCAQVLAADDVHVTEDASTVRSYVDLVLFMNKTAAQEGIACVVPPSLVDERTGERVSYEAVFDPASLFHGVQLFPSLPDVPSCPLHSPTVIYNASSESVPQQWRHWPASAFSPEVRTALDHFSQSTNIVGGVCLDDPRRPLAEAALHLLRGSANAVLASARGPTGHLFVTGKWRILDDHVQRGVRRVLTLLSPSLFANSTSVPAFYTAFGLRSHYPRLGEDVVLDVLDALVCRLANKTTASEAPDMLVSELLAGLLEFVNPSVLKEDLELTRMYSTAPSPPFLLPLDTLPNNGFSNLANAAQVLAYLGQKTGLRAAMVPLSMQHLYHVPRPWSDVLSNVSRFYLEMRSLRPPVWAMLRHPSLLVEVLDSHMLSAGPAKLWTHNTTCRHIKTPSIEVTMPCMAADDPWMPVGSQLYSKRTFQRLYIASNAAEWERLALQGHDVVLGEGSAYLGLSENQAGPVLLNRTKTGRDIVLRPFRGFNFQNGNAKHVAFSKSWRATFTPSQTITDHVQGILQKLHANFTCYHARVADEFMVHHHADRPQFARENVFGMLSNAITRQESIAPNATLPFVYITSDVNEPIERVVGWNSRVATSCHAFGCPKVKDGVTWGLIERDVCASAAGFAGNIYSTFTLSICARRNDQSCHDYFNQSLSDGRLLF